MSTAHTTLNLEVQGDALWDDVSDAPETLDLKIDVYATPKAVRRDWHELERGTEIPFVTYAWAEAWFTSVCKLNAHEPYIVVGRDSEGTAQFIMPFMLERRGPFRVLLWPGSAHCSYQCGLFSKTLRNRLWTQGYDRFWKQILGKLDGVDAIAAYGLPELAPETDNPLHALPWIETGCSSRNFRISGDWNQLHEAKSNAKVRRNERRCERRLEELGTISFKVAETIEDRLKLVDALLEQKSAQLTTEGLPDFTCEPGVRTFYRRLAKTPYWLDGAEFFIAALELDGKPVAINLGLISGAVFHGLILSMSDCEACKFGPGQLLLRRTFEHFCSLGIETVDMGVGEGAWKDRWGDAEVGRRDVIVPLTIRGRLFSAGLRCLIRTKSTIKNSPILWRLFSRYRRLLHC